MANLPMSTSPIVAPIVGGKVAGYQGGNLVVYDTPALSGGGAVPLTPAATVVIDWSLGSSFFETIGQNQNITFLNDLPGKSIYFEATQNGAGGWTINLPTGCLTLEGNTPTADPAINAVTAFDITKLGTNNYRVYVAKALSTFLQTFNTSANAAAGLTALGITGAGVSTALATAADGSSATGLGFRGVPVNSQSANYTTVMSDNGKLLYHPVGDANARTFTIDSNANVAQPIGATISFYNDTSQVVTIAITTDTLVLAGTGTTGSRSLAQYGMATAVKLTSTRWVINGNAGLT